MSDKTIIETKTLTNKKTTTEIDGTIIDVVTTTISEKYSDGSSVAETEQSTTKTAGPGGRLESIRGGSIGVGGVGGGVGAAVGGGVGAGVGVGSIYGSRGVENSARGRTTDNSDLTPANSRAPKVENTTDKAFIQECLETHNRLRARHGSPPLTLDADLGKIAQAWAKELAKKGAIQDNHSGFGENVYWNPYQPSGSITADTWYSEIKDFHFHKMEGQIGTDHFTQLIWRSSTSVGIAMEPGQKGFFVVANYYPAGNVVGRYQENIRK